MTDKREREKERTWAKARFGGNCLLATDNFLAHGKEEEEKRPPTGNSWSWHRKSKKRGVVVAEAVFSHWCSPSTYLWVPGLLKKEKASHG